MWGCNTHWYTLPKEIRDSIWQGWKVGKLSPAWIEANNQAQEWIKGIPERAASSRTITPIPGTGGGNVDPDATRG